MKICKKLKNKVRGENCKTAENGIEVLYTGARTKKIYHIEDDVKISASDPGF
jgi:hypothetical protein